MFPQSSQVWLLGLERASDRSIWEFAKANEFVLVTLDTDFVELAALLGPPPKVIRLGCGNQTTTVVQKLLRDRVEAIAEFDHSDLACLKIY